MLTNHHASYWTRRADFYITTQSRRVYSAEVKGAAPYSDLAVLEVTDPPAEGDFVPIVFGDGGKLRKGQIVIALGNPYAIARDGSGQCQLGHRREPAAQSGPPEPAKMALPNRPTLQHFGSLMQTDAKLNLGTSGGAL